MTKQQTLVQFLEERLREDQEAADRMAAVYPEPWDLYDRGWMVRIEADEPGFLDVVRLEQRQAPEGLDWLAGAIEHVAMHSPSRVLREVAAKRAIIELADEASGLDMSVDLDRRVGSRDMQEEPFVGDLIIRQLAAVYSDHPEYREEWKP